MNTDTDSQELREVVASMSQLHCWLGDLIAHAGRLVKNLADATSAGSKAKPGKRRPKPKK